MHIIANNLIGFTTVPRELHSSRFAAQLARRQSVPIFHVNGEDVDAVIRVGRIALEYRYTFGSDVVVDLIGYRRHGHSEVDDPTITQPLLYKAIKEHPPLWEIYAEDIGIEDAQARGAERSELNSKPRRRRPGRSQKSPRCGICRATGTITRAAATKPEYEVETGLSAEELQRDHSGAHNLSRRFPHSSES